MLEIVRSIRSLFARLAGVASRPSSGREFARTVVLDNREAEKLARSAIERLDDLIERNREIRKRAELVAERSRKLLEDFAEE